MKNLIAFLIFATSFLFLYVPSKACDLCGCGAGSYYLGAMPQFQKTLWV